MLLYTVLNIANHLTKAICLPVKKHDFFFNLYCWLVSVSRFKVLFLCNIIGMFLPLQYFVADTLTFTVRCDGLVVTSRTPEWHNFEIR